MAQGKPAAAHFNVVSGQSTGREFFFEFGELQHTKDGSQKPTAMLVSRLATSPAGAKDFHRLLGRLIDEHERRHGTINTDGQRVVPAAGPLPSPNRRQ